MAIAADYGADSTLPTDEVQVSLVQASGNSDSQVSGSRKRGRNASACSQCHSRKQKVRAGLPVLVFRTQVHQDSPADLKARAFL